MKLPHSKIAQPFNTRKKSCLILGITLKLVLQEQLMNLLSWEEYWDTSLRNYRHAGSFTVFGASQQRAEKQHSTIWRAEPAQQAARAAAWCPAVPWRAQSRAASLLPARGRAVPGKRCGHPTDRNSSRRAQSLMSSTTTGNQWGLPFQAIHKIQTNMVWTTHEKQTREEIKNSKHLLLISS